MKAWRWAALVVGLGLITLAVSKWLEPGAPASAEDPVAKECEQGDRSACLTFIATPKKACAAGDGAGCRRLGTLLRDGDYPHRVNVDPSGATGAFDKGCQLGDAASCTALGDRLAKGQGARPDADAAAKAYARGCQLGDAAACSASKP